MLHFIYLNMKSLLLPICLLATAACSFAQLPPPNYDESKIPPYTLPDLLVTPQGTPVNTATQWEQEQRPRLLQLFEEHVYGKIPGKPAGLHFKLITKDENALGGKAISKQVTIYFTENEKGSSLQLLLYLPKSDKKVAVFTGLNFKGNQTADPDKNIAMARYWKESNPDMTNAEETRGIRTGRWPLEKIIERGYGVATAHYYELEPDHKEGWKEGIRTTLKDNLGIAPEEWTAIGAWAWGLSRIQDYLETDEQVDAMQTILLGHSRLGKTALWLGANDTRFAKVIANESGEGGAALSRRWYGETIEHLNTNFPHWFTQRYKTYNNNAAALPVDQHMLLALIAPRPLYIASAQEDQWADPTGEFLAAKHALPVYRLYKKNVAGLDTMPGINQPVGETVRYHIRSGKHDVIPYDWDQFLNFADQVK